MYTFVGKSGFVISCPIGVIRTKDATQKQLKYLFGRKYPFLKNLIIFKEKEKDDKKANRKESK